MPKNVGDLGKLNVAKAFTELPKVQKSPNLVTLVVGDRTQRLFRYVPLRVCPLDHLDIQSPCEAL